MELRPGQVPSTGWLIWQVALRCRNALDRALAPLGLTNAQYGVLAALHGLTRAGVNPSQRELADVAGLEPMYVSKLARSLQDAGLVERATDPADSRAIRLALTDEGVRVMTAARRIVIANDDNTLTPLGGRASPQTTELHRQLIALLHHLDGDDTRRTQP